MLLWRTCTKQPLWKCVLPWLKYLQTPPVSMIKHGSMQWERNCGINPALQWLDGVRYACRLYRQFSTVSKMVTHVASMMTPTPVGLIAFVTAFAICFVSLSWTKQKTHHELLIPDNEYIRIINTEKIYLVIVCWILQQFYKEEMNFTLETRRGVSEK